MIQVTNRRPDDVLTHCPVYHHEQPMSAVRKGDRKIVENLVPGEVEFFNLEYDVCEMAGLKHSIPDKFKEMKAVLQKWQEATQAPMPFTNPQFDREKRYEWGRQPYRK